MDPLSVAASIIAVLQLSEKVLKYLRDVKDASKDRDECRREISNLYSLLTNLECRLEDGTPDQEWKTAVRGLGVEHGPLDQFKQALEMLHDKMTDHGRLKRAGEALMWKFKKEEITSILARMERLKVLVGIALEMDHFKLSQAIKNDTQAIQDDTTFLRKQIPVIQSKVDAIGQQHDSAEQRRLLEWVSTSDYPAQQSDIMKRREPGTGQWFLDAPETSRWLSEPKAILFCPGIPGAGKTMIAAIAIDHLLSTMQPNTHGVAYVYCNYKSQGEQDVQSMLTAILKQLVAGHPPALTYVDQLHQRHANRGTKPSLDEIIDTLQKALSHYPHIFLVIDALDECKNATRHQLLTKVKELQAGGDVRLLVTARFIPDIEDALTSALRLEVQASREDVKRFIANQIYRLPACIQRSSTLQDLVQAKVLDAVDGMFLLARLHVDSLLDKRTAKDVKASLASLTQGATALDAAYAEALQRIEGQLEGDRELAKDVLSWITYAKRPLTTTEICCALAVEPEETEIDPENVPDVEDLVSVCAGLVIVDEESAIIRLVHYTTQEYFERIGDAWIPESRLHIAKTCLTYLCFEAFANGSCTTGEDYEKRLREHQFLDYAAKHWGEHVRAVEADVVDEVCLFLNSGSRACATQVLRLQEYYRQEGNVDKYTMTEMIHELACYGLAHVAKSIITGSGSATVTVNSQDSRGNAPLFWAAEQGQLEMVKMLLDNGADINAQNEWTGDALYVASENGHEPVVKALLDKGANVNARGEFWDYALIKASDKGDEQVVEVLLDNGADVYVEGAMSDTAMAAASQKGHESVVKLLLHRGAGDTAGMIKAMVAASSKGHERIVEMLLDHGADINANDEVGDNALSAASYAGYDQVVKLLLHKGAQIITDSNNALVYATFGGEKRTVELLLDNGADVNTRDEWYTALSAASHSGNEQLVELLLDEGADIEAQSSRGTPLQVASKGGHIQVVEMLLDRGADVNAQEKFTYGYTALHVASEAGRTRVVELLLNRGADINAKSRMRNHSPLQRALYYKFYEDEDDDEYEDEDEDDDDDEYEDEDDDDDEYEDEKRDGVVKLLLERGAQIDANDWKLHRRLHAALDRGDEQMVRVLLGANASPVPLHLPVKYFSSSSHGSLNS